MFKLHFEGDNLRFLQRICWPMRGHRGLQVLGGGFVSYLAAFHGGMRRLTSSWANLNHPGGWCFKATTTPWGSSSFDPHVCPWLEGRFHFWSSAALAQKLPSTKSTEAGYHRDTCFRSQVTEGQKGKFSAGEEGIPISSQDKCFLMPSTVSGIFHKNHQKLPAVQWGLSSFLIVKWKESTHVRPAEHAASTLLARHCEASHTLQFQLEAFVCSPSLLRVMCARARNTPLSFFFLILLTHPELLWR